MNIWNNYITSVRTKIQVKQDKKLLTERQWKLKHFVKINDKCGKYLRTTKKSRSEPSERLLFKLNKKYLSTAKSE